MLISMETVTHLVSEVEMEIEQIYWKIFEIFLQLKISFSEEEFSLQILS